MRPDLMQGRKTTPVRSIIHARCGRDVRECTCDIELLRRCDCAPDVQRPAWQEGVRLCLHCNRRM